LTSAHHLTYTPPHLDKGNTVEMVEVSIGASHEHGVYFQTPPNRSDPTWRVPRNQLNQWIEAEKEHDRTLAEIRAIYRQLEDQGHYEN
jgi:hypothetical protein